MDIVVEFGEYEFRFLRGLLKQIQRDTSDEELIKTIKRDRLEEAGGSGSKKMKKMNLELGLLKSKYKHIDHVLANMENAYKKAKCSDVEAS